MKTKILSLVAALEDATRVEAATEWILSELDGPASVASMRHVAERELARPRDSLHRAWAVTFLEETKGYAL